MRIRIHAVVVAALALTVAAPSADAAVKSVFDGAAPCVNQGASHGNVRFCSGLVRSFDGAPIDVNVTFPADPGSGGDGNYPVLGIFHGWGGAKVGLSGSEPWAKRGYLVFSMSDRGWGNSCGGAMSRSTTYAAACAQEGFNHFMDTRYEVRDAQELIGRLADERSSDGLYLANASRIGAAGASYGGATAMALAALKKRIMLPNGTLVPWLTPKTHRQLQIAAASPQITWTDLAYSLMPNGSTLDYAIAPNDYGNRIGVWKTTWATDLFTIGVQDSNYALPLTNPEADLYSWFAEQAAGEPYDQNPLTQRAIAELTAHHSAYYIDHSIPPAPLLISSGFSDLLFPVDEALRLYNRTKAQYPNAFMGLEFLSYGHVGGGQSRAADVARVNARQQAFFDWFLKGEGTQPFGGVEALTEVCGSGPSGGPYTAPNWSSLAPGEVQLASSAIQVITSGGDPNEGGGACVTQPDKEAGRDWPGTAVYRLPAATGNGYTLLGAPTIVADILSPGPANQIAARLFDVAPNGTETLITRGAFRPEVSPLALRQVFQLHPGAWHFAAGHVAKLELLTADVPFSRPSNGQTPMLVAHLSLRLPVHEAPNGGAIQAPLPKVLPAGYTLAPLR